MWTLQVEKLNWRTLRGYSTARRAQIAARLFHKNHAQYPDTKFRILDPQGAVVFHGHAMPSRNGFMMVWEEAPESE